MSGETESAYGLIGAFADPHAAVAMARHLRREGFRRFEIYSPLPLEETSEFIADKPRIWLALIMFAAAIGGAVIGFIVQYVIAVIGYPINIGGRPLNSWPAFIPVAWEICALFTVYIGFAAFLAFCRLPKLYHPVFNAPGFERASQDRIFLCVETRDPRFDNRQLQSMFHEHRAVAIGEVPL